MKVHATMITSVGVLDAPRQLCGPSQCERFLGALLDARSRGLKRIVVRLGAVRAFDGDALYAVRDAFAAWRGMGGDAVFAEPSDDLMAHRFCMIRLEDISGRPVYQDLDEAVDALLMSGDDKKAA